MTQSILHDLESNSLIGKLEAVKDISQVPNSERQQVFEKIHEISEYQVRACGVRQIHLCPSACKLFFKDPDPRIRVIILLKAEELAPLVGAMDIFNEVIKLSRDSEVSVRSCAAKNLFTIANLIDSDQKNAIIEKQIIPALQRLFLDSSDDVKISAAQNLYPYAKTFGFDSLFDHFGKVIQVFIDSFQWRFRVIALEMLSSVALSSNAKFVNECILPFLIRFIHDKSYKVRECVVSSIVSITEHLGYEWFQQSLSDHINSMYLSSNFYERQLYLEITSQIISFYPPQYRSNLFQPFFKLLNDPVHNVTITAIKVLGLHKDEIHPFRLQHELLPILQVLSNEDQTRSIQETALELITQLQ